LYLNENDIGKLTRIEGSLKSLRQLNPFCSVEIIDLNLLNIEEIRKILEREKISVLVVGDISFLNKSYLIELNGLCRQKKIGFVIGVQYGIAGTVFTDFGDKHEIFDRNGESFKTGYILQTDFISDKNLKVLTLDVMFKNDTYYKIDLSEVEELKQFKLIRFGNFSDEIKKPTHNDLKV
jgi:ubiquitin-activating enzyme E1